MKKIILIGSLLLSLVGFAQKKSALPPEAFFACWSASYEENQETDKEKLFRPCDYNFPPSRFRQTMVFDKKGTCQVLQIGETDAHYFADCRWTYDKKKKLVNIADDKGKIKMKIKIVSVDKEKLKIVFIE